MIRLATPADIPRLIEIRSSADENRLTDPGAVTAADLQRFIEGRALWAWQEGDEPIAGFAACDTSDGSIRALLVAPGHDGRGIGRALLKQACEALRAAGHQTAMLMTESGSVAERRYRAAGWTEAGFTANGALILGKAL